MQNFYANDLKLHDITADNDFMLQIPIQGLDSPEYRLDVYSNSGEDGATASSAFYGARLVTLEGRIKGSSVEAYEDNRRAFSRALAINRNAIGVPELIRFTFTTLAGRTYFFDGLPRRPQFANTHIDYCDFMVSIEVPEPQLYKDGSIDSGNITLPVATGVTFPVTFPVIFGGVLGGSWTTNNEGTLQSLPLLTLTGVLTNPVILNVTTDQIMQINYTLGASDVITIDMKQKSILLNGTSNIINTKSSNSEWWGIQPGVNVISFSSGSGGDTGILEVAYNAGFVGV
jgi:phage-related protein